MCTRIGVAALLLTSCLTTAFAAEMPGVTEMEIKIGTIFPFSGPASQLGNIGKGLVAYVRSINDRGGINGRKIDLIAYDDGYSPPKAIEQSRRLVESDEVAFMFGELGTPGNSATVKYLNSKRIPDLFVVSGASKFGRFSDYPYTTTGLPSYATEGKLYAKFIAEAAPGAKVAILFQNDDLGKDFVGAFREAYKSDFEKSVVTASYETDEPTVDSQVINLKSSGATIFLVAGIPKFAAQALKKSIEVGWRPLTIINLAASSVSATLVPVGLDKVVGVITSGFFKDPNDPRWANDVGMAAYHEFFARYLQGSDFSDLNYLTGYQEGIILEKVLAQCGNDLSRENVLKQSRSIPPTQLPTALPGILVNTSASNSEAWTQLHLQRWNGSVWEPLGKVFGAGSD
jgi:branched-chain amino acid transport system substrate-binding protein